MPPGKNIDHFTGCSQKYNNAVNSNNGMPLCILSLVSYINVLHHFTFEGLGLMQKYDCGTKVLFFFVESYATFLSNISNELDTLAINSTRICFSHFHYFSYFLSYLCLSSPWWQNRHAHWTVSLLHYSDTIILTHNYLQ